MQKLFKCGNYSREETIWGKTVTDFEGQPLYTYLLIILIRAFISTEEARLWFFKDFTIKLCYSFFVIWSLAARESNIHICFFSHKNNLVDFLNLFHLFHYKQQAIKYCMSLNLDWDYLEILLLLMAFGTLVPVVICVAIFCCCQHQFSILKSPIICQKCLFYVYFEILLLLLLAFGIPAPVVVVCGAIFCCWLLPPPTNWGHGIL